jgi:hypothetical protein
VAETVSNPTLSSSGFVPFFFLMLPVLSPVIHAPLFQFYRFSSPRFSLLSLRINGTPRWPRTLWIESAHFSRRLLHVFWPKFMSKCVPCNLTELPPVRGRLTL